MNKDKLIEKYRRERDRLLEEYGDALDKYYDVVDELENAKNEIEELQERNSLLRFNLIIKKHEICDEIRHSDSLQIENKEYASQIERIKNVLNDEDEDDKSKIEWIRSILNDKEEEYPF